MTSSKRPGSARQILPFLPAATGQHKGGKIVPFRPPQPPIPFPDPLDEVKRARARKESTGD